MVNRREELTFRSIIKVSVLISLLLVVLAFVIFQARYLILGPQIRITEEPIGPQSERQVFIAGDAYNISHLWLNGRPIYTDLQGKFKEAIMLENGYTVITIRAEDRYGRSTEITRTIVYGPMTFYK
jgi:hypothetical protein